MVSGVTQQHRACGGGGGGGGSSSIAAAPVDSGGGGPSIRFEGITLELSSFSGCQFDFGKSGNLVLSLNGYTGTVSLQSSSSSSTPKIRGEAAAADSYALPLCSTSSEAGSLGVLDGAEAVAMDQSDYDMALSQLEHGDSPKSSFSVGAAESTTSPTTAMFNSPSAVRHACEGAQNPTGGAGGGAAAASGGSARKQQQQQQQQQAPSHVSPSSSMKSGGNSSVIAQQAASPSAGVGPRNKRSSPSSSGGAAVAGAGTIAPAVSPDGQCPSAAGTKGKPKGKRARRARGEESTSAPVAAAVSSTKTKRAAAAAAASKKTARAKRQQQQRKEDSSTNKENRPTTAGRKSSGGGSGAIVEAMDEDEDDDDDAHVQTQVSDDESSASEEEEGEEGGAASPSSSAAAAWIAISASGAAAAAAPPASPGPLSRSARAQIVAGVGVGVGTGSGDGGVGPMGRWGHTATMISESTMMVLGGQADDDAHQATLGDLYKFDFATESWSRPVNCDSIPRAWHSASFIKDKNLLVIFGGERTVDGCPECLDDIMVLDTDIDLLYPPAISGKSPTARSGHSAAIIGTDLVVFGGVRGRKWQNNVAVLDTERWHWRHPTIDGSNPAPRSYHSSTVVGNLMVVFGGNNQNESFDKVHVLDTSKSRWVWSTPEVVGVAPPPRTGHSAVLLPDGHTIFVHGGWDPEDEGGVKNFGDAYLLDTNLWEWTRGPEFLLGADEAGLRVGHTALLARCNSDGGGGEGDATAAAREGEGFEMKAAYFGGQDGDGVRRSELALLTL